MNCVVCNNCEVASDYPACARCAKQRHFPHVRGGCRHCTAMHEAELQTEPVLRRWEYGLIYGDDVPLMADMLSEIGVTI